MKVFYILSFILLTTLSAKSQSGGIPQLPSVKVARFFPNPAVSQITFEIEGSNNSHSFQIFNFIGKKVFEQQNVAQNTVVNVSDYYRGVYIFQLKDKTGKVLDSGKFQVSH